MQLHFLSQQDSTLWSITADEQLIAWFQQKPEDWQVGGSCDVYMFGAGRHGQLGDSSTNALSPALKQSFQQASQVFTVKWIT